jgi:hypothetical protein
MAAAGKKNFGIVCLVSGHTRYGVFKYRAKVRHGGEIKLNCCFDLRMRKR